MLVSLLETESELYNSGIVDVRTNTQKCIWYVPSFHPNNYASAQCFKEFPRVLSRTCIN